MRTYLLAIAKGFAAYLVLTMLFGGIHHALYDALPDEGIAGSFSSVALLLLAFLPALASGYLVGRLVRIYGIACGALSVTLGAILLSGIFFNPISGISQYLVFIIIGGLAGGFGEWHSNKKSA